MAESYVNTISESLIDYIVKQIKKKSIKEKIMKNIVDPLLQDMASRYYPYFMMMIIILLIIIILLVSILIVNITQIKSC